MSRWSPCKRLDFLSRLKRLGFVGPFAGGRHQFLTWQHHRLAIPSNEEYSVPQLRLMLREVETVIGRTITLKEWNELD